MRKIEVPKGTFENSLNLDSVRHFPSIECLDKEQKKELKKRIDDIIDFHSKSKLAYQAVNFSAEWLLDNGFEERDLFDDSIQESKKYFYRDPWKKSSLIAVHEGKKAITEGFHLINSHADSPCLKVKPRPLRIETDEDKLYDTLGIKLSTIPHGGIVVPYWIGQPVEIIGYTIDKNNSRREINFKGVIGVNSAHVDISEYEDVTTAFSPEKSLEIIIGYSDKKSFLKHLKFESIDDFANTHLWAVPVNKMFTIDDCNQNLLVGYGHDDRTSVFSTIDALIKTKNPEYSAIAWISDNEEIFDPAPVGTEGPLFYMFLENFLNRQEKIEQRKISDLEKYKLYTNSKMIVGDVSVASYGHDFEEMDSKSSAKIGLGAVIEGGDIQGNDPHFVRYLRNLVSNKNSEKGICHQICGQFYHQDMMELWGSNESDHKRLVSKGIPEIWVGMPCASLHSPVEIICPGDEYATSELYRRFFESK
ncbi:MAG: hypothetical protein M1416_00905 [Candidatus Pacearchaeota archaeon]|nr:hypothetical protein [Candidatus Pacearchaeota archaeon]